MIWENMLIGMAMGVGVALGLIVVHGVILGFYSFIGDLKHDKDKN